MALLATAVLTGCASFQGIEPKARPVDAVALAATNTLADARVADNQWPATQWWQRFGDEQLDALVKEALTGSPSLRVAEARVDSAVATATIVGSSQGMGTEFTASTTRQLLSSFGLSPSGFSGRWITTNQLALGIRYEVDFWGRNQAALETALGQARASQAEAQAARVMLAAAVVQAYLELARNFEQLDLARAMLLQRTALVDLARERFSGGIDTEIALREVESGLPEVRARIVQYEQAIDLGRNQLAALLGQGPDRGRSIARPKIALLANSPNAANLAVLPSRLPANLLGRRADITALRWRVEAARRDIDAAKAAFYPNINLVALVGLQSIIPSKLFNDDAGIVSFGPALRLPLFGGGTLRGALAGRDAEYDAAVERYNQLLADALREVADQVDALRHSERQGAELEQSLSLAEEIRRLAEVRRSAGLAPRQTVLAAEGQVLARRSVLVDLQAVRLALNVNLIRALGGGLEEDTTVPPARTSSTGPAAITAPTALATVTTLAATAKMDAETSPPLEAARSNPSLSGATRPGASE